MTTPLAQLEREPATTTLADPLSELAAAALAKDEAAFIRARQNVDWRERTPAEFMRAVRLALMAGAYRAARNLSAEGAAQYPDDADLQKAARGRALPKVVGRKPADPTVEKDHAWLKAHAHEYRGQWIALRRGEFLGAAKTLDELVEQVGDITDIFVAPIH
jgi:hypothetical protein